MKQDHAQQVKDLFQAAIGLAGEDRERFLRQQCGADAALRAEVEGLLGADEQLPSRFLAGAAERGDLLRGGTSARVRSAVPGALSPQETRSAGDEALPPLRIGGFRMLRRIGVGGMGTVYEAEQDHPRRRVAVKLIRAATLSESILRRFDYEVQVLGQLKHPGIAQIYEAGTYDDGHGPVPFFVMEFIHGPLLEFAAAHGLSLRQRLTLVADVCDAVHHAHQKGVIHRDLKPANILVEEVEAGEHRPKVLDFGVARAIHSDVELVTMHTEAGQLLGTLSYMSPEQVAGRPDELDVRSDVYSLGVLLYELLAGRLPYDLRKCSIPEAGTVICEQEPSRLSTHDSALRGDIETIVAKALSKEKEHRYASAAELGADIRRYLQNEPIVARPPSRTYQLRKFAQRNKAIVGGTVALFLVLIVGVLGTGLALVKAHRAERVAVERLEESIRSSARAAAVNAFLQEMLSSVDPSRALGREVTVRQVLDDASVRIESGTLRDQPDIEADLRTAMGTTYLSLGHYAEADIHLRAALGLYKELGGDDPSRLVSALANVAQLRNAQGRHAEEESMLREALEMLQRWRGENHVDTASAMQSLGAALRAQGRYEEAERWYRSALLVRRRLLGSEHVDVAQSVNSLGLLLQNRGDYAAAEPLFREALAVRRRLLGTPHPVVADGLNNLANLLRLRGNAVEAESLLREALVMRQKLLGPDHPGVAQSLNNLAVLLYENGQHVDAEPLYREALAIWRRHLPAGHSDIANGAIGLGLVLNARAAYAEAESLLREALAIREATLPPGDAGRLGIMVHLGVALTGQGRFAEAESLLVAGYQGQKDQVQVPLAKRRFALEQIIHLYDSWNRPESAARWRGELLTLEKETP